MNSIARLPKCPVCELEVAKDSQSWVKHSAKTYHEGCFQQFEARKRDRQDLHEYICELYRIPVVNGFMLKQIKTYETEYKYTLKGVEYALKYFHSVLGNPISHDEDEDYKNRGIGIVVFVYDEAKRYYTRLGKINKENINIEFDNTVEVVRTFPPKVKKRKGIDISKL